MNARREIERKRRSDVRGRYRHRGVMIAQVTDHGHMVTTAANVVAAAAVRDVIVHGVKTESADVLRSGSIATLLIGNWSMITMLVFRIVHADH